MSNIQKLAIVFTMPVPLATVLAATEAATIKAALVHTRGRKAEAAVILGISRKELWEKMKGHGIESAYGADGTSSAP
jgi:DNA-binding NtrC family response regulator